MSRRPNFIVLIADDHRQESIGAHGCGEVRTPNLDALARRGTDFTRAYCQGSTHPAVCVPSRASLMTGRSIFEATLDPTASDYTDGQGEVPSFTLPAGMQTFPERLRQAGYRTHAIGKWHNDRAAFARSFSSADRVFFGGMSDHDRVPLHDFDPTGAYPPEARRFEEGLSTDLFADSAIRFLSQAREDEPFCLYVAFTAPHDPRTPPAHHVVPREAASLPRNYLPIHPFDTGDALVRDEVLAAIPRQPEEIRQHIADYYGMIQHLDEGIGAVLRAAESRGLLDDTVVVYTADHGLAVGQHGLMGKQNLYEHSIHVPLVFAGPGIRAGATVPHLVWHADTRATLLDLAGLSVERDSRGVSLARHLAGDAPAPRDHLCAAYRTSQRMIRTDRWKLIRYYPRPLFEMPTTPGQSVPTMGSAVDQLFDLDADPDELVNLAWRDDLSDLCADLAGRLSGWQHENGDPWSAIMDAAR